MCGGLIPGWLNQDFQKWVGIPVFFVLVLLSVHVISSLIGVFLFVSSIDGVCWLEVTLGMTSLIFLFTSYNHKQVTLLKSSEGIFLVIK